MVGGQRGVDATLDLLVDELRRAMCLLGTPTVAAIGREHVRLRARVTRPLRPGPA